MSDDSEMLFEESGGFGKWSLGIDRGCSVVVKFNRYPNVGEIHLYDIVGDDLERLAKMFQNAVDHFKALKVKNEVGSAARECAT